MVKVRAGAITFSQELDATAHGAPGGSCQDTRACNSGRPDLKGQGTVTMGEEPPDTNTALSQGMYPLQKPQPGWMGTLFFSFSLLSLARESYWLSPMLKRQGSWGEAAFRGTELGGGGDSKFRGANRKKKSLLTAHT